MAANVTRLTATIPAGQSLSNSVNTSGNYVIGLIMPAQWTNAHVTVLTSTDNVNFNDMFSYYDLSSATAAEFKFNVTPGVIVAINPDTMLMARHIKLRSGTRETPVIQQAARTFTVLTVSSVAVQVISTEQAPEQQT